MLEVAEDFAGDQDCASSYTLLKGFSFQDASSSGIEGLLIGAGLNEGWIINTSDCKKLLSPNQHLGCLQRMFSFATY